MNLKLYLKSLSIIHIALILGQVVFGVVCIVVTGKTEIILNPEGDVFFLIVPAAALSGMIGAVIIFKKFLEQASVKPNLGEKLVAYRTAIIVRYALLEGPSLFGIVIYYLNGNLFYLFISGFIILFFLTLRTTKEKLETDLKLDYKEKLELDKMNYSS